VARRSTNALNPKSDCSSGELQLHQLQRLRAVADSSCTDRLRFGVLVVHRGHAL